MSKHPKPAVLAFGRAGNKPPRAAWFTTADSAVAHWAAAQHSLTLLPAAPELLKSLETPLTEWQLGADGHPLLHVIAMHTFTRLQSFAAQAEAGDPAGIMAGAQPATPEPPAMTPEIEQARSLLWDAIGVNSVVLTLAEDPTLGWWEAIVLAVHNGSCTLCWRDFPADGLVRRKRQQLALLHSAS